MLAILTSRLGRALWIGGRSSRLEWWLIEAFVLVAYAGWDRINLLLWQLGVADWTSRAAIMLPLFVVVFWLNVASSVRRLHDRNRAGWWVLLYAVPLLGLLWQFIECGFLPPRDAHNRFDPALDTSDGGAPTVRRADPPRPLKTVGVALAVLALIAVVGVLATSRIRITEIGPNDRLPGDFARDPDER